MPGSNVENCGVNVHNFEYQMADVTVNQSNIHVACKVSNTYFKTVSNTYFKTIFLHSGKIQINI